MRQKRSVRSESPASWLPIDSRLILPLFSFGHVRGTAKIFLTIEMILAAGVLVGTFALLILHFVA